MSPNSRRWSVQQAIGLSAAAVVALGAGCHPSPAGADETFEQVIGSPPGGDQPVGVRRGTLWYHISVQPAQLEVAVRLNNPPDHTTFFLPGPWAGRANFDRDLTIDGARSANGPVPLTIDRDDGRIDIQANNVEWVQLSYSVELRRQLTPAGRFRPQYVDGVLFGYGPAFIVLPSEQIARQVRDIPVEVRTRASWRFIATWRHLHTEASEAVDHSAVHGFIATNPAALRDAFIAAGPAIDIRKPATAPKHSAITVGFSPTTEVDRDAFSHSIAQIVDAYRNQFGDLGPATAYVRRVASSPAGRGRGVGRRGGFVVELPAGQQLDDRALLLLAHEAGHLWNGHLLTPKPAAERQTRWFKEGVTHYIALKMLARLGIFTRSDVLAELSRSASYYQRNPAARNRRSTSTDRARLPYDRGVLIAVGLDAALVDASNGRVDVMDWVELLVDQIGQSDHGYDRRDLREALVRTAGSPSADAVRLWDEILPGNRPVDPAEVFSLAGLHWLASSKAARARLLPIDDDRVPFARMFPHSP